MNVSEDEDWESACQGKERFAAKVVASVRKRYPKAEPYKCKFCGFFHLGRQTAKRKRRRNWK
jgi:hypothetical protein